jgi:hypothetical protein
MDIVGLQSFFSLSFTIQQLFILVFIRIYDDMLFFCKSGQMHFPTVVSDQWALMTVNHLFDTINFFDPSDKITEAVQDELMTNLVCYSLKLFSAVFC